jgi:multiple sugar transport system permease protein
VIAMMVLPPQITQVPVYLMWAKANLTGTLWPLILPNLLGDAFSIFLLRQFLLTIPEEYADAARIDGCSEWRVMTNIILPMAKPAIAATGMFMFFASWNDYYGPLLYTSENTAHWTVSLGLAQFRTAHQVQWNLSMAATLLVMLPVMVLFFFAQKAFVEGVTLTGVKG